MTTSAYSSVDGAEAVAGTAPEASGGRPARWRARSRLAACLLPALVIAFAGFQRRWMSDDGHIYVRTVRQVLAGNGPVFNPGERAESSTGTLWQWLLVIGGAPGFDVATVAMYGGLLLTAAGFVLAGAGALRVWGGDGYAVPCGALVLLALPPVWDFATSGLETGLATCWIAGAWLALVGLPRTGSGLRFGAGLRAGSTGACPSPSTSPRPSMSQSLLTCAVIGLGPLVRPDLALVSVVFLAAQWVMVRPSWRGVLAGAGLAGALPVAYEIFRMGYYGHLVPLPGVTKEASRSLWTRGFGYLGDFVGPYALWLPLVAVGVGTLVAGVRPSDAEAGAPTPGQFRATPVRLRGNARTLAPVLAPLLAGTLCWVYVIKVGGDFMHGRMFLPGLLLMLLPVFVVPATRVWRVVAVGVAVWAVVCAGALRIPYEGKIGPSGIADERGVYVWQNGDPHPLHHDFSESAGNAHYMRLVRRAARSGEPTLLIAWTRTPARTPSVTGVYNVLGMNGAVVPLSGAALDPIGLAYPLAAHSEPLPGRVGHDKSLPYEWIVADRGTARGAADQRLDPARVDAARRALRCGRLAELRAATRAPMTAGRFWHNLTGAVQRTSFRFPNDPVRAERELCGRDR
ncbi:hypothetical protein ABZS76_36235 [Streptomyces sp. NPDC005562]|uniref:hypothetical protein n=1 Tax=Streptomyces sp. NPDC005562 TaxID=3154890 RepID=UPI00339E01BD